MITQLKIHLRRYDFIYYTCGILVLPILVLRLLDLLTVVCPSRFSAYPLLLGYGMAIYLELILLGAASAIRKRITPR